MPRMERIYHHYKSLEEFHNGMWKVARGSIRHKYQASAADLMRCPEEFKEAMLAILDTWPKSCEANLTVESVNKIAWLGHAGCCHATGSPEECTRIAWHTLTKPEQDEANRVAGEVLDTWLARHGAVVAPTLFDWSAVAC